MQLATISATIAVLVGQCTIRAVRWPGVGVNCVLSPDVLHNEHLWGGTPYDHRGVACRFRGLPSMVPHPSRLAIAARRNQSHYHTNTKYNHNRYHKRHHKHQHHVNTNQYMMH
jgi:hypothetical protein